MTTSEPVLTAAQLNRALLARQCLLEPVPASLPAALEQVAGLQAQYRAAYLGLWARVDGFRRSDLTTALEDRSVIQATLMRQTIHVVSQHDYVMMAAGVRRARRHWWLRVSRSRGLDEGAYETLADALAPFLKERPRTTDEMLTEIERAGYPKYAFEGLPLWLDLVRVPPPGTWDHPRADLFGLADDWIHPTTPRIAEIDTSDGLDLLVQRYLRAFGPAPLGDAASWAGVPVASLDHSAERLDLRRFQTVDGTPLLDLPYGPLPDPGTPAPVRFLPTWDAALLVHAKRAEIVSEEHRAMVFDTSNPSGVGAFLVDGRVAGRWRIDEGVVRTDPFEPLASSVADEVRAEAERLASFHL